jgi:hypothetical protein
MVHLECGVELSDHDFIPIVLKCHDLLQHGLFNFGKQTLVRLILAHEVPIHPLLVRAHDSLLKQAPEEVILVLGMKERTWGGLWLAELFQIIGIVEVFEVVFTPLLLISGRTCSADGGYNYPWIVFQPLITALLLLFLSTLCTFITLLIIASIITITPLFSLLIIITVIFTTPRR